MSDMDIDRHLRAKIADLTEECKTLRAGHDRYEVARRMSPAQWRDAWVLNQRTGKPFDEIVSDLAPFFGLRVGPNVRAEAETTG